MPEQRQQRVARRGLEHEEDGEGLERLQGEREAARAGSRTIQYAASRPGSTTPSARSSRERAQRHDGATETPTSASAEEERAGSARTESGGA